MAKIVEICGSPGVGKSTIFSEIICRWERNNKWTVATNLNPQGPESSYDFIKKIVKEVRKGKISVGSKSRKRESMYEFVRRIYREIKKGKNYVDEVVLKKAGDRFVAQYPRYVDACWNNIFYRQKKSSNGLDLRFEKTEFIYRVIKKIQVSRERKADKVVILDEGLVNMIDRGLYKSTNSEDEREEIYKLLEEMPVPDALVYIEIDLQENVNRILHRSDMRDMHRGLCVDELINVTQKCRERILTSIQYLESKGIPVLYLNSNDTIQENADKIIAFAESIELATTFINVEKTAIPR
ncbi:AAA family ATPase [Catalinimonas niigatensis]|uniref:AAA family ATPase n=1 Tax=Catalinimonas niigatensis TaxID=1397264 RepID=UPI002664E623|nr:AAA family ATPase [Catalinimonas niigatensis]WPP52906.1 AAA family ATPase [Catalinimonas niigatensis]